MNTLELVNKEAFSDTMEVATKTGVTRRLMLKKEFKQANPDLTGNKLTKAYNLHIKQNGKSMASAAVAFIADSGILLKSVRNTKNTVNMSFVKPESLKDKPAKGRTISTEKIKETVQTLSPQDLDVLMKQIQSLKDSK